MNGDPYRNVAADIIHLALDDISGSAAIARLSGSSEDKIRLRLHNKALYYFRIRQFTGLSEALDLDPDTLVKTAFQRAK